MKKFLATFSIVALLATLGTAQTATTTTTKKSKHSKAAKAAEAKAAAATTAPAPTAVTAAPATTVATPAPAAANTVKAVGGPIMTFEKMEIDYGTITQGSDPLRKFKFKNTGTEPLVIKNARGSCGCTVPNYKKEPVMPGESSEVEVRYDTQRVGPFTKTVTLESNEGEQPRVLTIRGTVTEAAKDPGVPANAPSIITTPKQ